MAISWFFLIAGALAVLLVFFLVVRVMLGAGRYGREYDQAVRHLKTRTVDCPESGAPAAVATREDASGRLHVTDCNHWTEERHCDQKCVRQIASAPDGCLVRTILTEWYQGNTCGLCGKKIGKVDWFDFKPALMSRDGTIAEWHEVPPELLTKSLSACAPVCTDCFTKAR